MPVLEVALGQEMPRDKEELRSLYDEGLVDWLRSDHCANCLAIPEKFNWMNDIEDTEIKILGTLKRRGELRFSEPTYIGTNAEPLWDERLTVESKFDRSQQAYAMCLLDYDYHFLSNAFLIQIGPSKVEDFKIDEELKIRTEALVREEIITDMNLLYGNRDGCEMIQKEIVAKTPGTLQPDEFFKKISNDLMNFKGNIQELKSIDEIFL